MIEVKLLLIMYDKAQLKLLVYFKVVPRIGEKVSHHGSDYVVTSVTHCTSGNIYLVAEAV